MFAAQIRAKLSLSQFKCGSFYNIGKYDVKISQYIKLNGQVRLELSLEEEQKKEEPV